MSHEASLVPCTPIYRRYRDLKTLSHVSRLDVADQLVAAPEILAQEFAQSIAAFSTGYRNDTPFFPAKRFPRAPTTAGAINDSTDLAWFVKQQHTLPVIDNPALGVDWVSYEVSIIRTRDKARFDDEQRSVAGRALRPDLLLVNPVTGTPVVGEVKIGRDEPFVAAVQLLTYIAHLVTPSQHARLVKHFPDAQYRPEDPPRVDAYLLLHRYGETEATHLSALLEAAEQLTAGMMHRPEITRHVRQFVCLDVALDDRGTLTATTRWLHQAQR